MQRLFKKLQKDLAAFIEQRDNLLLLASCSDNDTPFVLQVLRGIELSGDDDVFLLFADPYTDPDSFASVTIERLRAELLNANEWLQEEGETSLPELPESTLDEDKPGVYRLVETMMFTRSLIPQDGRRLIWAMVPIEIADRASYLQMMSAFFPTQEVQPWMRQGIRIVIRDEPDTALIPKMTEVPRTLIYPIDIGPQAMTKAIEEDAEDESIPPDDRAQALLALAIQDYGYGRREDALEKYDLLLGYFQQTKNIPMQAVVLNNIGDVYHLAKEYDTAQIWYETAVPPAIEGENPVIFHTVVKNLADVVYKQQNYPMAEQCYKDAGALATHLCDPEAKAQDLEGEGLSQEHQGELDKAIDSWESAAKLCRSIGEMEHFLRPNLEHLARAYQHKRDAPKLSAIKEELGTFGPAKDRCET